MEESKKKWILFAALAAVVIGLTVVLALSVFAPSGGGAREPAVTASIPDGEASRMEDSKSKAYRGSTESYFEGLSARSDASEDISLVSSSGGVRVAPAEPAAAARPEDAAMRVFGTPPGDDSPASAATGGGGRSAGSGSSGVSRSSSAGGSASRPMTDEERLEYDRRRAEMVRDVLTGGANEETLRQAQGDSGGHSGSSGHSGASGHSGSSGNSGVSGHSERSEESVPQAIDLSAVGASDGIVSSLDEEPSEGVEYGVRPFRCMFVRDQKLSSGQRVTLRLLEDYVEGGIRIPANTHLAAICKIGDRLELQVRSLEMNGRIIPLALDAYDTDGLQGIYCPETSSARASKQASQDAISTAGTTFGGLVGDLANTVLRTGASIARSASGELSVNVVSGYEFYLVKSERR